MADSQKTARYEPDRANNPITLLVWTSCELVVEHYANFDSERPSVIAACQNLLAERVRFCFRIFISHDRTRHTPELVRQTQLTPEEYAHAKGNPRRPRAELHELEFFP